jgi:trigger factor
MHRLEGQGMSIGQWLAVTGQDQTEFLDQIRGGAGKAVLADLALRAVVAQEGIVATDEELQAEIDRLAERTGEKPQKVRKDLDRRGLLEAVRSDIARGKALQLVVDAAVALDVNGDEIDVSIPTPDDQSEASANESPDTTPAEEPEA